MAGLHGKNAELRLSTTETRKTGISMTPHPDAALAALGIFVSDDEDWKFAAAGEDDEAKVTYESPSGTLKEIGANSRRVHYATGSVAIDLADIAGLLAGSVTAEYTTGEMETVGNILGQDRSVELNVSNSAEANIQTAVSDYHTTILTDELPSEATTVSGVIDDLFAAMAAELPPETFLEDGFFDSYYTEKYLRTDVPTAPSGTNTVEDGLAK